MMINFFKIICEHFLNNIFVFEVKCFWKEDGFLNDYIQQLGIWGTSALISFLLGLFWNNYLNQKNVEKNLRLGVLALLRSEIIKEHAKCKENGFCSAYSINLVNDIYESYHQLGGNGVATKLIEEIRQLPIKV